MRFFEAKDLRCYVKFLMHVLVTTAKGRGLLSLIQKRLALLLKRPESLPDTRTIGGSA